MEIIKSTPVTRELDAVRAAFLLSTLWLAAAEWAMRSHQLGLMIAAAVGVLMVLWMSWLWRRGRSTSVSVLAALVHLPTSLAALSFAGGHWSQHLVAVTSAVVLWMIVRQRKRVHDDLRGRMMALLTGIIMWFGWYALLSASIYLNVSLSLVIGAASALCTAAALLVWFESGLSFRTFRFGLLAVAWLGAELFVAVWWLPTTLYVGSVIGATVLVFVIQASRYLWAGEWQSGRGRRYLVTAASICLAVLMTARWI